MLLQITAFPGTLQQQKDANSAALRSYLTEKAFPAQYTQDLGKPQLAELTARWCSIQNMIVLELKDEASKLGLIKKGTKDVLLQRLREALQSKYQPAGSFLLCDNNTV